MKDLFDCKDEKITEKAFLQSLIISVVSILLCIVALCSVTYAWFTDEMTSGSNTLMSGFFDVTVNIVKTDDNAATASEAVMLENGKYTLTEAGTYTVTLTPTNETTVKGYCIVTVNGKDEYRTKVIVCEKAINEVYTESNAPFSFTITTDEANTVVEIVAYWGIPADIVIDENGIEIEKAQVETENAEASE